MASLGFQVWGSSFGIALLCDSVAAVHAYIYPFKDKIKIWNQFNNFRK